MTALHVLLYAVVPPFLFLVARRFYRLYVNYCIAREFNVSIVVTPVGWQDDAWMVCWEWFKWLKRVPFMDYWFDFSRFGWPQDLRFQPHHRYGDAFVIVSPGGVELVVNDPQACNEIQTKYKNWFKPEPIFAFFDIFGKHVVSVNGDDWQRHRRIVNPAFQEQTNKMVWNEARSQASQMLNGWLERGNTTTIGRISTDCILIAMHVLSAAGFGQKHDFRGGLREVPSGHTASFSDTVRFLLTNTVSVLMFRNVQLPDWILPQQLRSIKHSVADFELYMREAIAYTKGLVRGGSTSETADMASALIKANEAAKDEKAVTESQLGTKSLHLSDDHVLGNLYIINIAGYESTANALTYAIPYLAVNPEIQDWVREEIAGILDSANDENAWDYEHTFPQLIRCLAVMYETLRLWSPVTDSTRWPAGESQILDVGDQEILVPKGVFVSTNNYGMHSDPRWWGEDSLEWKPKRWIAVDEETGKESIASAPLGAFISWSTGPRVCPGKKFSQVEFTAVISLLLAAYKMEPLVMEDKGMRTKEDARKAVLDAIWASTTMITPKIGGRQKAGVVLVKR